MLKELDFAEDLAVVISHTSARARENTPSQQSLANR